MIDSGLPPKTLLREGNSVRIEYNAVTKVRIYSGFILTVNKDFFIIDDVKLGQKELKKDRVIGIEWYKV